MCYGFSVLHCLPVGMVGEDAAGTGTVIREGTPYGDYGQAGTNDPRIPRLLLARLLLSFEVVFTQDRRGFARPGATNPLSRFEITRDSTDVDLHALFDSGPQQR